MRLPPLARQAVLAQLDAADDQQAGSLKTCAGKRDQNIPSACCLQEGTFLISTNCKKIPGFSKELSDSRAKHVSTVLAMHI